MTKLGMTWMVGLESGKWKVEEKKRMLVLFLAVELNREKITRRSRRRRRRRRRRTRTRTSLKKNSGGEQEEQGTVGILCGWCWFSSPSSSPRRSRRSRRNSAGSWNHRSGGEGWC